MNNPIIYDNVEYKDKFVATTRIKPSLKMRLEFLFCAGTTIETEIYTKEVMPAEKTLVHVHIFSLWDKLRVWNYGRKRLGGMETPMERCSIQ